MSLFGKYKQTLLVICDGMGKSQNANKNAVRDAKTPNLDRFFQKYPNKEIIPGGEQVGLPKGVAGNSEVGHLNIGAGRPVRQDLVRINEAIEKDSFKNMDNFQQLITKAQKKSKRIHLMGLLSDGGVHSHIEHLKAISKYLESSNCEVFFHAFMDGRDTPKTNGPKYIKEVESWGNVTIASMQGRSIGMDRDRRWEKIEDAYKMFIGEGNIKEISPSKYIEEQYSKDIFDEFIETNLFKKEYAIQSEDVVFFINFRPDRAKQISQVFCDKNFPYFQVPTQPCYYLCMSPYIDEEFPEVPILFDREKIRMTLSEFISNNNLKQLKIAETEKYAHVTYFLNGGAEAPFKNEERVLVNSPKDVATYDLKPEMSAPEVLEKLKNKLDDESISLYVCNFANPDMVGHTGNYEAAVSAMEYVDYCLGELEQKCLENDIAMLVTADHGNCDEMVYSDGSPQTSHSKANVPFILISKEKDVIISKKENALMDVAPTIITLLGIKPPVEFEGTSVFN